MPFCVSLSLFLQPPNHRQPEVPASPQTIYEQLRPFDRRFYKLKLLPLQSQGLNGGLPVKWCLLKICCETRLAVLKYQTEARALTLARYSASRDTYSDL